MHNQNPLFFFFSQSTDNIAKDPPVKIDTVTEVDPPRSLKEVPVGTVYCVNFFFFVVKRVTSKINVNIFFFS